MATPLTPEQLEPIRQALLAGSKIEAIKLYRAATNVGLAEARTAVEKLESQWRAATPEQFSKPARTGCFAMLVLGGGGFLAIIHLTLAR